MRLSNETALRTKAKDWFIINPDIVTEPESWADLARITSPKSAKTYSIKEIWIEKSNLEYEFEKNILINSLDLGTEPITTVTLKVPAHRGNILEPAPSLIWIAENIYNQPFETANVTVIKELPVEVYQEVEGLFRQAKEQHFEDGMESEFSKELISSIKKYGNIAVEALTQLITLEQVDAEVASEALRWLGRMEHPATYQSRLWLLERSLSCSSAFVRDGAILGLASLDDRHSILYLKRAIQNEPNEELQKDMDQVLEQLGNA